MVQTKSTGRRAVVYYEDPEVGNYLLQDILELAEPERTNILQEWLEAGNYDTEHDGTVLIGTPNKQPMSFRYNGKVYNVPPAGRRTTRETALRLLLLYGQKGRYYGRDQATGLAFGEEESFTDEQKAWAAKREFHFITNYLVQRPEKTPATTSGKKKATDLPEIEFVDDDETENEEDNG